jgi:CheY-like chemotaxis protein
MARIVVIHEISANHKRVHDSLPEHEVLSFRKIPDAMRFMEENDVDLIISAVHLIEGNVFDLLHWVKANRRLRRIPFVYFCAEPTELAKYVSGAIRSAAQILGATRYVAMEEFDQQNFRNIIQEVLESPVPLLTREQLRVFRESDAEQQSSATGDRT